MPEERKPKELNENELKSVSGGGVHPVSPGIAPSSPRPVVRDGELRIWAKCNICGCEFIWREKDTITGEVTFEHKNCTNCGSYDFTETRTVW